MARGSLLGRSFVLAVIITAMLFAFGCAAPQTYMSPPEDMAIENAARIDLASMNLGKITKTRLTEIDGISIEGSGTGYLVQFRYLNKIVAVSIAKFTSPEQGRIFWNSWAAKSGTNPALMENGANVVGFVDSEFAQTAWQKGSWFTSIKVPVTIPNSETFRDQVRDYINYYYSKL